MLLEQVPLLVLTHSPAVPSIGKSDPEVPQTGKGDGGSLGRAGDGMMAWNSGDHRIDGGKSGFGWKSIGNGLDFQSDDCCICCDYCDFGCCCCCCSCCVHAHCGTCRDIDVADTDDNLGAPDTGHLALVTAACLKWSTQLPVASQSKQQLPFEWLPQQ